MRVLVEGFREAIIVLYEGDIIFNANDGSLCEVQKGLIVNASENNGQWVFYINDVQYSLGELGK